MADDSAHSSYTASVGGMQGSAPQKPSDPNLAGSAPTDDTLDPSAGIMDSFMENEDYKTFLLGGAVPESRLLCRGYN